jgi:hypothetical protein
MMGPTKVTRVSVDGVTVEQRPSEFGRQTESLWLDVTASVLILAILAACAAAAWVVTS